MLSLGKLLRLDRASSRAKCVARVQDLAPRFTDLSDEEVRRFSLSLRYRVQAGEPTSKVLPEAFALVCEASSRALQMRHYPVQIWGGIALHDGDVIEMQTGEGKTLTASLPLFLHGLLGEGAHLATANDYLASRDAALMRPLFKYLGFEIGAVEAATPPGRRRAAYDADVTYGTAKEFGFDFLRDRLRWRAATGGGCQVLDQMQGRDAGSDREQCQRAFHFALVDEADSILIDEARTPLIVSSLPGIEPESCVALYRWAAEIAPTLEDVTDYDLNIDTSQVLLTATGRRGVRVAVKPTSLNRIGLFDIYEHVERAVLVHRLYQRDRHFVLRKGEVVIVDEATGRLAEGRQWRDGLHQAIQAREGVDVTPTTGDAARITLQNFFGRYQHLAGMTGTANNSRRELRAIYNTRVEVVPTNRPPLRERLSPKVYRDESAKWSGICDEVAQVLASGRPVLIGTRSIDRSEKLSSELQQRDIPHHVLNARHVDQEARIVAEAGVSGRVTVATNMAGRGTDILLDEQVLQLGGLHVICSELHESSRIDRQLIGRCGRQGDPGSFRHFLALDDEILSLGFGEATAARLLRLDPESRSSASWERLFLRAQRRVEATHFRQRRSLQQREKQRLELQEQMGLDPFMDAIG
jgi:preprotein translocase subunit SecA